MLEQIPPSPAPSPDPVRRRGTGRIVLLTALALVTLLAVGSAVGVVVLTGQNADLQAQVDQLAADADKTAGDVATVDARVDELDVPPVDPGMTDAQIMAGFNGFNDSLSGVSDRVDALEASADAPAPIDPQVLMLQGQVNTMKNNLSSLCSTLRYDYDVSVYC